jgi:predicted 2-oxoglutarate/Fe(II)-dependent dioxygenase YbiX
MYRLLKYETGAQIHPHTDHDPYTYGSCTFNLNDNYSGGEFAWFRDRYRLKLGRGDGLIFPADFFWVHEVKPITEGVRYSTNSFLLSIPDIMKWEASELVKKLKENPPDHPMFQNQLSQKYNINPRKDTSNEKNSNGTGFSNCNADICANCQDCGTKES